MISPTDVKAAGAFAVRQSASAFIQATMRDKNERPLVQSQIHHRIQNFMNRHTRGVIQVPRDHGKTTQIVGRTAWKIGNNPNKRFKIVSSTSDNAVARGKSVKELVESNDYKYYFPTIEPGREWNESKFSVKRTVNFTDSTLECYGLDGCKSGPRADELILDDPDDSNVVTSQAAREANWHHVSEGWLNQLEPDSCAYLICTPWHESDIAHRLIANGWPVLSIPIVDMKPVWPEYWNAEALLAKRKEIGSMAFARGYELKPMSTEASVIKPEWFKYWTERPRIDTLVVVVDPAISEKESADYTAIGLLGGDIHKNAYLLDITRKHMGFPETLKAIIAMAESGQARYGIQPLIGIESVAYQKALPQQLQRESRFVIKEIKAMGSKYMRVARAGVNIENGHFYLKGLSNNSVHPEQAIVFDEAIRFPAAEHDDTLDCIAYGIEMLAQYGGRMFIGGFEDGAGASIRRMLERDDDRNSLKRDSLDNY